jgi:hypothetical protein
MAGEIYTNAVLSVDYLLSLWFFLKQMEYAKQLPFNYSISCKLQYLYTNTHLRDNSFCRTSAVSLKVRFVWYYNSHFSVGTNGKKRNISYFFAIGGKRTLYPWVCNLGLWDSGQDCTVCSCNLFWGVLYLNNLYILCIHIKKFMGPGPPRRQMPHGLDVSWYIVQSHL